MRVYAIGDIHGRLDLLDALACEVKADLEHGLSKDAVSIFLGDYIDRGPDSAGVVERLMIGDFPTRIVALRGNHEAELLRFLEDDTILEEWRRFGGLETLTSYGVDVEAVLRGQGYKTAQAALKRNLPLNHLKFLERTPLSCEVGDYFFCHAGVRPNVPLDRQDERDLLWIREEFTNHRNPFGKIIVHGHTPTPEPEILANRIGVDTGAYATGRLTCLILEGQDRRFIST